RTSTQHYKSAPENLPEIARQLGVAHILEGSVQKSGDTVRVHVQLIKAANESHLWADTFDRKLTDIFSVESDVAKAIAEQLRAHLLHNSSNIPATLAYVCRRPGQWDRSDAYFNDAERLDPRNVNLLTQHALLDIERRNFSPALRKLDYILDITPGDVDTLAYKAAVAQAEGDLRRASAMLDGLRPTADQSEALETQVYQAILKR